MVGTQQTKPAKFAAAGFRIKRIAKPTSGKNKPILTRTTNGRLTTIEPGFREARSYRARLRVGGETAQASCSGRGDRSLTGPLSLLLWTLLGCSFFLKVGGARALSRRTATTARSPTLIVPSVDGFRVILWFACGVRHVEIFLLGKFEGRARAGAHAQSSVHPADRAR